MTCFLNRLRFGIALCLLVVPVSVLGQSKKPSAKAHFERAQSYDAQGDPRAEQEYRQAIAKGGGVYPEAWEWLSNYLAKRLRFAEAANSWRTYVKQANRSSSTNFEKLRLLDRAAKLKLQIDTGQSMTADEMVEMVQLVDRFGQKGAGVPYAERAIQLHPDSVSVLVALADLIKFQQKERALELLNRAVALKDQDASVYVARGWYYFWVSGNLREAEADFRCSVTLSNGLNASAWQGLADTLVRQGHRKEAVEAYRKYLTVRPPTAAHHDEAISQTIKKLLSEP